MEMTESEIYREWKQSKNPAKQVNILADINRCKPAKIISIIGKIEAAYKKADELVSESAPAEIAPIENAPDVALVEVVPVEIAEPVPAKSADDLDKRLTELYKAGATYKEMTAALSVPISTIRYHLKKLTASGEITNRLSRKNTKPNAQKTHESKPERTGNARETIPADDMMQWLEVLRTCAGMVEGVKITHICANDDSQAEVGFTANGNNYLLRVEVRR